MLKPAIMGGTPTREKYLPYCLPVIEKEEIAAVVDTLKSDWITTGPKTHRFEELFEEYVGCKHAIAVSSCTAALHLPLVAAEIGPGDEVITTPFTFAATVNVIVQQGAKPVLVDIRRDTYNLDPDKLEAAITSKTRAIIPVHYAGQPCDMAPVIDIARRHHLMVIEDAAHALSAKYQGRNIGNIGDVTAFSFYATKIITTAEGGMATTNDDKTAEKMRILSLHGISADAWNRYSPNGSWYYEILAPGFKYNMTDIQAAMGIEQLKKLDRLQDARKKIAAFYGNSFADVSEIVIPRVRPDVEHSWHLYPILVNTDALSIDRKQFSDALKAENIGTSVHFIPIHLHPFYRQTFGFKEGDFPETEYVYNRIVSLPLYPRMSAEDSADVVAAVRTIAQYYRK